MSGTRVSDRLLTVADAAVRVHRSRKTIYRWISEGVVTMLGGRVRESDVVAAEMEMRRRRKPRDTSRDLPVFIAGSQVGVVRYFPDTGRVMGALEPGLTATRAEVS